MKKSFDLSIKPTKQLLIIFILLFMLSSIPNVGHLVDETICASKPCQGVKLQNPLILPYSWIFPEKKCNFCNLAESCFSALYENSFPVIHLMNIAQAISYLLVLSFFIDFGITKLRGNKQRKKKL